MERTSPWLTKIVDSARVHWWVDKQNFGKNWFCGKGLREWVAIPNGTKRLRVVASNIEEPDAFRTKMVNISYVDFDSESKCGDTYLCMLYAEFLEKLPKRMRDSEGYVWITIELET